MHQLMVANCRFGSIPDSCTAAKDAGCNTKRLNPLDAMLNIVYFCSEVVVSREKRNR